MTMTTIGFGDVVPKTMPGRILTFMLACFGVVMTSLMVVALSNYIILNRTQKKAFFMIKMIQAKKNKFESAANLIVATVRSANYFKSRSEGWVKNFFMGSKIAQIRKSYRKYRDQKQEVNNISFDYPLMDLCIMQNEQLKVRKERVRNQ